VASLAYDEPIEGEAVDETMPDSELVSILQQHETQAIGYTPGSDDEISSQQERAINYYYRVMDDVPAQEGSSSVVDGTVQVVIDNALAALLKPFVSSDETVRFSPRGPEDVETADQATEYANYVLHCDNNGFSIFHDWFKDALLTKLGVVKIWWEREEKVENGQRVELLGGLNDAIVRMRPDYRGEENGTAYLGQMVEDGRIKIANIPPEEFRISPFSRNVQDAIYTAHVPLDITRSDLIAMGFDAEVIEALPALTGSSIDNTIRVARYQDERIGDETISAPHVSQERVALRDEYIRVDYDGDGIAELRRVVRVEDTILLNEEVDESPFATLCPVPMPHKVFGMSLADLVIELQRINTVLWRQMLDNLYKSNNPRPVVAQVGIMDDGSTAESLEDNAPGAAIMVKTLDGFRFDAVPYTADASLPMLEMVANMAEERTGISKTGQGLDTNALRKSGQMTATEMAMISAGKNARVEMIARIFAETGVKRLFKLMLGLLTKHQPKERMIRLRNEWVPVDPRGWPEMDLEVSVGLGIGEKTEQVALAEQVLTVMNQLGQTPYASLIDAEKVYNATKRLFTAAGIKNTDEYLNSPQEQGPQEEKPDPEMMKVQAEMQMQQAKLQSEQALQAAKLEMQREEAMQKQQLAREEAEFEAQLAAQKAQAEMAMAREKMAFEQEMAEQKMRHEAARMARDADRRDYESETKLSANRPGGSLAE